MRCRYWQSHASVTLHRSVKRNMADSKSAKPILSGQPCMVGARHFVKRTGRAAPALIAEGVVRRPYRAEQVGARQISKGEQMKKAIKGYMPMQNKIPPMPKGGSSRINWSAQNINFGELVPPPKGEVRINRLGTVVMNIETYNEYQNIAVREAIRLGRFEDEL